MRLIVNGEDHEFSDIGSVEDLLRRLEIDAKYRAVAVNRQVVSRTDYGEHFLKDGDRIEIVRPVSGG